MFGKVKLTQSRLCALDALRQALEVAYGCDVGFDWIDIKARWEEGRGWSDFNDVEIRCKPLFGYADRPTGIVNAYIALTRNLSSAVWKPSHMNLCVSDKGGLAYFKIHFDHRAYEVVDGRALRGRVAIVHRITPIGNVGRSFVDYSCADNFVWVGFNRYRRWQEPDPADIVGNYQI